MNAQTKIDAASDVSAVPAVYAAINAVMEVMSKEGIGKDRKNTQQNYQFRGIDDVYNTLCGVLAANKLMMLPFVQEMKREERQTKSGGALNYTILTVDFKLVSAVDGSSDVVRMIGEAMDAADKSANKAQSAALKYAALQVFMIPTEGDNDADATTHEVAPSGMPDAEYAKLANLLKATGVPAARLLKEYGVKNLRLLDQGQYADAVNRLNDVLAKKAREDTNKRQTEQQREPAKQETNFAEVLDDEVPF